MIFDLYSTGKIFHMHSKSDMENLMKLQKYGFKLELIDTYFKITNTPTIEINTLEDLIELNNELDIELIINKHSIEIYNDYRE